MTDRQVDCPACQAGEPCKVREAAEAELARMLAAEREDNP